MASFIFERSFSFKLMGLEHQAKVKI